MSDPNASPEAYVDEIVERLEGRFPRRSETEIRAAVLEAVGRFSRARVKDFLPVIVEREAKARLERPLR